MKDSAPPEECFVVGIPDSITLVEFFHITEVWCTFDIAPALDLGGWAVRSPEFSPFAFAALRVTDLVPLRFFTLAAFTIVVVGRWGSIQSVVGIVRSGWDGVSG